MIIQKKRKLNILPLILILVSFLLPFFNFSINTTYAEETVYSNVLEDLQKDENFNIGKYPVIEKNYSLQLMQIAESEDQELFVYVYQPSGQSQDLRATTINISVNEGEFYTNYKLKYLNSNNVFYKYLVEGFSVAKEEVRYYDITSIFRDWNKDYDKPLEVGGSISEVPFKVAKQWKVETKDNMVKYDCADIDVIEVLDKYVGFVRYDGGYQWDGLTYSSCDNHFVAFSTDKPIDCLLEADVYFETRTYDYYYKESMIELTSPSHKYGDVLENYKLLTYDEEDSYKGNVFHKRYTWNKISSVNNFIENVKSEEVYHVLVGEVRRVVSWTNEGLNEIKGKQWALRFETTDYEYKKVGFSGLTDVVTTEKSTQVMNVSVLRLKFRTDGQTFNLGVIDNKQTGDGESDSETNTEFDWADWVKWFAKWFVRIIVTILTIFLIIFLLITFFPIIFPIVVWVFKFIIKIVWYILKGIWWVITLPLEIFKE